MTRLGIFSVTTGELARVLAPGEDVPSELAGTDFDQVAVPDDWPADHDWDEATRAFVARDPMPSARAALSAAVKQRRDDVRDGGCLTLSGRVDTDLRSQLNIAGAVSMAAIGGAGFSVDWRMADNSIVELDAAEMTQMGLAVGAFVAACQARKNALDAEIATAGTVEDLDAIDIETGWPE